MNVEFTDLFLLISGNPGSTGTSRTCQAEKVQFTISPAIQNTTN